MSFSLRKKLGYIIGLLQVLFQGLLVLILVVSIRIKISISTTDYAIRTADTGIKTEDITNTNSTFTMNTKSMTILTSFNVLLMSQMDKHGCMCISFLQPTTNSIFNTFNKVWLGCFCARVFKKKILIEWLRKKKKKSWTLGFFCLRLKHSYKKPQI